MMTAEQFASTAERIAKTCKTLYVSGGWGQRATDANKTQAINKNQYNKNNANRIRSASADTYFFDCVCLLKSILWGFNFSADTTGGARYASNGVPDVTDGTFFSMCKNQSTDFSKIKTGSIVWMPGHVGVYIGGGLAVECTPAWNDGVQITAVGNIGTKPGYNTRRWTKHGESNFLTYGSAPAADPEPSVPELSTEELATMVINGVFGNGTARKTALGSRYEEVQRLVDQMLRVTPEKPKETIYTVQRGDNLSKIARQYGTTVDAICKRNGIVNANLIFVGQRLVL